LPKLKNLTEVCGAFLRLGLISFGGPVAHLGYFRREFVERRCWLDDAAYADLVALCQFLPGPASSQVAFGLGMRRAGILGGLAASIGFMLPSAVAMILFGYGVASLGDVRHAGWLHGLKLAAVAVVALAVWAGNGDPDRGDGRLRPHRSGDAFKGSESREFAAGAPG
jgi:chromate transporter